MSQFFTPKIWFADPKAFRLVFLPRISFLAIAVAAVIIYLKTINASVFEFLAYGIGRHWSHFQLLLATTIPLIVVMCLVFAALETAYANRYEKLLAEELRHLTEPAGWKETLTSPDAALFQRVVDASKSLGFRQVAIILGEMFLGRRPEFWGLGYGDVIQLKLDTLGELVVVVRPLIPSRVSRDRYKNIVEELKRRVS